MTHKLEPGERWTCSANGQLTVKLLGKRNGAVNTIVLTKRGTNETETVVRTTGAPPDGRCVYQLIRGWWKMRSHMQGAGINDYHFVVEADVTGNHMVSLYTPNFRNATARYVAKHGMKLPGAFEDAPMWETLAEQLCQFLIEHATIDAPRPVAADGKKLFHGYDQYRALVAHYLATER